jgi:folate-dependent phosphoribosylglycinamide formyltransferase PurN
MRVAGFMSGSGSNIRRMIEHQKELTQKVYEVVLIFTDNGDEEKCKAKEMSIEFGIPCVCHDIVKFYKDRGYESRTNLSLRPAYYEGALLSIREYRIDLIALGGFMSIVTSPLLDEYRGRIINVHPADLSKMMDGKRKYTGPHAVRDAILAGERYLRSTVHIVRKEVDSGEILAISKPVKVKLPYGVEVEDLNRPENSQLLRNISDENQDRLKENGDWIMFPMVVEMIGKGRFGIDNQGNVFLDGRIMQSIEELNR